MQSGKRVVITCGLHPREFQKREDSPSMSPAMFLMITLKVVLNNLSSISMNNLGNWISVKLTLLQTADRIRSTNPGAEPPRDARDSGSARSHSTHLETSSSD